MASLESEVRNHLRKHYAPGEWHDFSQAMDMPDFSLLIDGKPFYLEVKEKRRPVNLRNWPQVAVPEKSLFLIDELTARRLIVRSPSAGVLVRDNIFGRYHFINVLSLWLMCQARAKKSTESRFKMSAFSQ